MNPNAGNYAGYGAKAALARDMTNTHGQEVERPTESPSGIRDAMQFSEDTLSSIHAALSHLESRLDVVLTPGAPTPATTSAGNTPMPTMSNFRERLGIFNCVLSDALTRLNTLRDRIEV